RTKLALKCHHVPWALRTLQSGTAAISGGCPITLPPCPQSKHAGVSLLTLTKAFRLAPDWLALLGETAPPIRQNGSRGNAYSEPSSGRRGSGTQRYIGVRDHADHRRSRRSDRSLSGSLHNSALIRRARRR